jgi:Tfp pilus assembly protein PilZ
MLYHITILIIFLVLACAVIILFKKAFYFRQQTEKLQKKGAEFINKLVAERELKPAQAFQMDDFKKNQTTKKEDSRMERKNNGLSIDEIRAFIFGIINTMPKDEMRELLKYLEERKITDRRKFTRKDFFRIIDYAVEGRYYRDFIHDISENGIFIETSNEFSVGQDIIMTFASPDQDNPFKIHGKIKHTHTDGIGVKFKIESQVQQLVLKSFVDMIQS